MLQTLAYVIYGIVHESKQQQTLAWLYASLIAIFTMSQAMSITANIPLLDRCMNRHLDRKDLYFPSLILLYRYVKQPAKFQLEHDPESDCFACSTVMRNVEHDQIFKKDTLHTFPHLNLT